MNQAQLLSKLWVGSDILRGEVEVSRYMDILLNLLSLKVLNDNDDHPYILPQSTQWRELQVGPSIKKNLHHAFQDLESENPNLQGTFTFDHSIIQDDEVLRKLIRHFDGINLSRKRLENPDPLDGTLAQVTEGLLEMFADMEGKRGGQFYSPRVISILLAKLLQPQQGTIYDGTAGSGGFLIEAAKEAQPTRVKLYGQEINPKTLSICKQNVILHGLYDVKLKIGDTIRNPKWVEGYQLKRFDTIMMNPPFSLHNWGQKEAEQDPYGRFKYGVPSGVSSDLAFVQHALASLTDHGKAAIVVPMGVLFRSRGDQLIRKALLEEDVIEAVIALPPNLFYNTGIPVAVLILNKKKAVPGKVQFILAKYDYQWGRGKNTLRKKDIAKIVDTYRHKQEVKQYSRLVSLEEIKEMDWIMTVERYIEAATPIETTIGKVMVSTKAYEQADLSLKPIEDLTILPPFRGINPPKDSDEEPNCHLINLADVQDGNILLNQLKPTYVEPRRALRFEAKPGDVLVSSRGTVLKIAVVPDTPKKLLPTNNFIVLRLQNMIYPHYLKAFLESPIGVHYITTLQGGSVAPILNPKHLSAIPFPLLPYSEQERITHELMQADEARREAIRAAENEHQQTLKMLYDEMGILRFIQSQK